MGEDRSPEDLASAIYGTILSTALITAYSEDPASDPLQIAVAVVATSLVFWLAHAYAGMLARGAVGSGQVGFIARLPVELARHWPLVTGSLPPVLPLLLAPLGIASDDTAESLAIAAGIVVLAGWGMAIEVRLGRGWVGVVIGAGASAAFGLIVVGLKVLVH